MGHTNLEIERLQTLADRLDFFTESDFLLLSGATESTIDAWRKRKTGPDYVLLGKNYFYPKESVSKFLRDRIRVASSIAKAVL